MVLSTGVGIFNQLDSGLRRNDGSFDTAFSFSFLADASMIDR